MNKEVIYLEPEDDITDILTKLQQAEQKLVALVPPKKGTMLRSAVNMKLVARVAKECDKVAVIVTADPAIIKMAMAARIPIAKTLQSRPVVPTEESVRAAESSAEIIDEDLEEIAPEDAKTSSKSDQKDGKTASKASGAASKAANAKSADTLELTEEGLENGSEEGKNNKKAAEKGRKGASDKKGTKVPSFDKYRKWIILGVSAGVLAIIVLVWAFVFAPAVSITVAISSSSSNLSENVRFTTDPNAENIEEGVFYVEKQTYEHQYTADFSATGEEDRGEKATGELSVTFSMRIREYQGTGFAIGITEGDIFETTDGLRYRSTETVEAVRWDGDTVPVTGCNSTVSSLSGTCTKTYRIKVEAVASGEEYNTSSMTSWNSFEGTATVVNSTAISGGTTKMVKVVSQEDADKAKDAILEDHKKEGETFLFEDLPKNVVAIKDSFGSEAGDINATPAVGDEVGDNTTPNIKVNAIYYVYTIDSSKIEEFIKAKTSLASDQKIYSIGEPYFERYAGLEDSARLKTVIETGPTVTEEEILDKAMGRKTGEVQSLLRSINGVSSVEIRTSFFWVWSVPNDPNKVTVELKVEDR